MPVTAGRRSLFQPAMIQIEEVKMLTVVNFLPFALHFLAIMFEA
jgi:hypothetical protein